MTEPGPLVVVIAGPNGAGKSTWAPIVVRDGFGIRDFVNADEIAKGLSAFDSAGVALQAGRLMWKRLRELADARRTFAFETTLATRSYAPWLRELRQSGYRVEVCFVLLPSAEMALARVADRVRAGGHDIPTETVRRRYDSGLRNLFGLYLPLADRWTIVDNSRGDRLLPVASGSLAEADQVADPAAWERLKQDFGFTEAT